MRLLIFVNKFDEDDDLLGFFPGWVAELTKTSKLIVVAQYVGQYKRASNLEVVSIDKNNNPNPLLRAILLDELLFKKRRDYDGILVIMAPSWVIVSAPIAKIFRKKLYLWYAVWRGNWKLKLAEKMADKIFCSVKESFPFPSKKVTPIGQGVDTDNFVPDENKRKNSTILFLGRISPVKKIDILIKSLALMKEQNITVYDATNLKIVGGPASLQDQKYLTEVKKLAEELEVKDKISWTGKIGHSQTRDYYQEADIFVNLTPTGSFDKTMLEAMACGTLVLASNRALERFLPQKASNMLVFRENDSQDLAAKLTHLLSLSDQKKNVIRSQLRESIINNHSQKQWAEKLISNF